jgi:predicted O-methyltransferase YrrM
MSDVPDQLVASILARLERIEGFLGEPEATLLMQAALLALAAPEPAAIVEIGSYCGRSTVALAAMVRATGAGIRVVAIDPHLGELSWGEVIRRGPTLQTLERNLAAADLASAVEILCQRSYEVDWRRPVGLLFIDGLHDEENVRRDFASFEPWLVAGALVAFDDCHPDYPAVGRLVAELTAAGRYRLSASAGRLALLERRAADAPGDGGGADFETSARPRLAGLAGELFAALGRRRHALEERSAEASGGDLAPPLVEIADVVALERSVGLLWGASVDVPRPGQRCGRSAFEVAGWALGRQAAVDRIEILLEGRVVHRTFAALPRPDVAAALPAAPGAEHSGFRARLRLAGEGNSSLLVRAVLADGQEVPIAIISIVSPTA